MSVHSNLVEVVCDGPREGVECPDSAAWTDYDTAADLRKRMQRDGWKTGQRGGKDQCPTCKKESQA